MARSALSGEAVELLARWLDLTPEVLRAALRLATSGKGYRKSTAAGGRALEVPTGILYTAHAEVLTRLLRCAPTASAAHGGVPGRSVLSHARVHLPQARGIIKLDLAGAYRSLPLALVARALRRVLRPLARQMLLEAPLKKRVALVLARLLCVDGHLPTGGPCSAALLNLACFPFDRAVERLVREHLGRDGRYSRYLDDVVVSTRGYGLPRALLTALEGAIFGHRLGAPNPAKTVFAPHATGSELEITGIRHDGSGFALSAARLERLQAALARAARGPDPRPTARGVLNLLLQVYGRTRAPVGLTTEARRLLGGRG